MSTCITGNGSGEGPKSLLRQPQQHDGVLARGEQQHGPFQFGDHLADDVHRLGFEQPQFVDVQGVIARWLSPSCRQAFLLGVGTVTVYPFVGPLIGLSFEDRRRCKLGILAQRLKDGADNWK